MGFCGRLCHDKGIIELIDGFELFKQAHPEIDARLLLVGPYDARDILPQYIKDEIESNPLIIAPGAVSHHYLPNYYSLMDVFVFPSYREGFGMTVIEASAMRLPILVSRSHGCVDSIREDVTGRYIDLTPESIATSLIEMLNPELRQRLGAASGGALLLLSVPLAAATIWLHFANKGAGAFFFQERPGKDGKIFKVVKFKTMTDERDADGNLLPDADRLTNVGRFVRSTSIDELPQLWNVLKGDMSLIGPRPLLVQYLPLYSTEQARRHEVRPGITGWAQCHGRNAISWQKKFELDVWYVDHISFVIDCKVILTTIQKVLKRADISSETSATMEPFNGNN